MNSEENMDRNVLWVVAVSMVCSIILLTQELVTENIRFRVASSTEASTSPFEGMLQYLPENIRGASPNDRCRAASREGWQDGGASRREIAENCR